MKIRKRKKNTKLNDVQKEKDATQFQILAKATTGNGYGSVVGPVLNPKFNPWHGLLKDQQVSLNEISF